MKCLVSFCIILYSVTLLAFKTQTTLEEIRKNSIENGCSEDNLKIEKSSLKFAQKKSEDLMTYCQSECGIGQCHYSIYLVDRENFHFAGTFSGTYQISKKNHNGYFDLTVINKNPLRVKQVFTLKFDGEQYQ